MGEFLVKFWTLIFEQSRHGTLRLTLHEAGTRVLKAVQEVHPGEALLLNDAGYVVARGPPQIKHRDIRSNKPTHTLEEGLG